LAALVFGMTVTYGLLRFLEPGQVPPLAGMTLLSIERTPTQRPEDRLFATQHAQNLASASGGGWQVIVIHDSQQPAGSYDTIDRAHRRAGKDGNGYHFVINNGTGQPDGVIEAGFRWEYQQQGDFFAGAEGDAFNQRFRTLGICLVGDLDRQPMTAAQQRELDWLVHQLQQRYGIPAERVFVDVGSDGDGKGRYFPHARFNQTLASAAR
jgi:hypothetical protein